MNEAILLFAVSIPWMLRIGFPTFHWVSRETFLLEAGHQWNVAYTKLDRETIEYQLEGTWKGNLIWAGLIHCLLFHKVSGLAWRRTAAI